jgi:para-nitrobenzyl esterase
LKNYNGEDSSRGVGGTKPIKAEEQTGPSSKLFDALGCVGAAKALDCARAKTSKEVLYAIDPNNARVAGWGVVVDGVLLPDAVPDLIRKGAYKKVPILTGFNVTEAGFGVLTRLANGGTVLSAADYATQVGAMPSGARILSEYPLANYSSPDDAYIDMSSQASHCAMLVTASVVSARSPLFMYEFNDKNPPPTLYFVTVPPNVHPGAFHTSEIAYVFQRGYPNELRPGLPPFTPEQLSLSSRMMHDWASFVKTGKPTSDGSWSEARPGKTLFVMSLQGDHMVTDADYESQNRCPFWKSLAN